MSKKDLVLSAICGELTAWFLIFVIKNPYVLEFEGLAKIESFLWFLPVVFPVIFVSGIIIAKLFEKIVAISTQVVKFLEIGVLNTLIDLGILNLLIWVFGITSGIGLAPLNTVSFLLAATNSYFWNKFWTFKKTGQSRKEFLQFFVVSAIGWFINTGIVVLGTAYIDQSVVSAGAWVNIVKIFATLVAMTWNFIGYKFIVFKS